MEWISDEDKLPETGQTVIAYGKRRAQFLDGMSDDFVVDTIGECSFIDEDTWIKGMNIRLKVSHWMPLPEPPSE